MKKIMVAYDFSNLCDGALKTAKAMKFSLSMQLYVILTY